MLHAVFAIELIRNYPNKYFVLHQDAVNIFFKGNIKLKRAVMSRPCMRALRTFKLKESFLQPLHDKEIISVPVFTILLKESCKRFLVCPLHADPFYAFLLTELVGHLQVLNWKLSVDIIFDLFY